MQLGSRRAFMTALGAAVGSAACSVRGGSSAPSRTSDVGPAPSSSKPTPVTATSAPPATGARAAGGADLVSGPRGVPAVALTFHGAGEAALTTRALAALAAAGAHATVLAVGTWLEQNPALAAAVLDGGHELGNHTWSHLPMRRLDAAACAQEVDRAKAQLTRLTGSPGRWFRPSGTPRSTATIRAAALAAGYGRCLAYDVDPLDYTDPGPDAVTRRVLAAVRPGSIVSLHLGHAGTVLALPGLLTGLREARLRPVTVSALVGGVA